MIERLAAQVSANHYHREKPDWRSDRRRLPGRVSPTGCAECQADARVKRRTEREQERIPSPRAEKGNRGRQAVWTHAARNGNGGKVEQIGERGVPAQTRVEGDWIAQDLLYFRVARRGREHEPLNAIPNLLSRTAKLSHPMNGSKNVGRSITFTVVEDG